MGWIAIEVVAVFAAAAVGAFAGATAGLYLGGQVLLKAVQEVLWQRRTP